jgi:hypothetical protein
MTTNNTRMYDPVTDKFVKAVAPATTPNAPRTFDVERKHGVGQFLRAHSEAARVMARMRSDSKEFYSIAARARMR